MFKFLGTWSPGRPPRLSHSSWALKVLSWPWPYCFTSTEARMLIRDGDGGEGGRKSEGSTAGTVRKRPERPWTAARTMEVLRRCPLAITQRLVQRAIAVSTAVLGQSHNVRCTAVAAQLHLPPLDHLISPGTLQTVLPGLHWLTLIGSTVETLQDLHYWCRPMVSDCEAEYILLAASLSVAASRPTMRYSDPRTVLYTASDSANRHWLTKNRFVFEIWYMGLIGNGGIVKQTIRTRNFTSRQFTEV